MINKTELKRFLLANLGILIMALVISLISWRYSVAAGGMTGFAIIINLLTSYSVGTLLIVTNTILLLISFLVAGKSVGAKGIYGYIALSIAIDLTIKVLNLSQVEINSFLSELALTALAGVLLPLGVTLIIRNDYSIGNYTSIFIIIQRFRDVKADILFLSLDILLTIFTFFALGSEQALLIVINAIFFFLSFKTLLKYTERKE